MHKFIISLFLFAAFSCTRSSINLEEVAFKKEYFDLKTYFESEIPKVKANNSYFIKRINVNGATEEQRLDTLGIDDELGVFVKNNINRPALIGRYQVDSTLDTQQRLTQLQYTAIDEKLPVKSLIIQFDDAQMVKQIDMTTASTSRLLDAASTITYLPTEGYIIKNHQKIMFFGAQDMKIEVEYGGKS